ncbi:GntR family transcriptional regulator [Actinophytocola sediminis]
MSPTDGADAGQLPSRRIADAIRELITTGELAPGDKLPSERELAGRFGTARNTAREAIRLLTEEALVTPHHGKGVFVRETQSLFRWGSARYSRKTYRDTGLTPFRLEMQRQGKTASVTCVAIDRLTPPPEVAERLHVPSADESVVRRLNEYRADNEPVQLVTTYIRWSDAEGTLLLEPRTGPGGIYGRLEDKGHVMTTGRDEITARMPTHEEAEFLQPPAGVPVLDVLHTSYNQHGDPFEVTRFVHRADKSGLVYTFGIEN